MSVPLSGRLYLDSNVFIYSVEKIEPYATLLRPLWLAASRGDCQLMASPLALLETLVGPLRAEDRDLARIYRSLLGSAEVHMFDLSREIFEQAAELRATFGLKTPDALHAATAIEHGADSLLTNDPHFRRVSNEIPILVLQDLVSEG